MKIEILTTFKHDGQTFEAGEARVVDDVTAEYFCRAGWAKDLNGVVATGKPNTNDVVLMVDNITNAKNTTGV